MEFNWTYVWTALVINFLIVYIVPRMIKKPTGVKVVDDVILYLNTQKSFLLSSSIVLVAIIYGSHYWVHSQESPSAKSPDF